jgi:hypothetical protein
MRCASRGGQFHADGMLQRFANVPVISSAACLLARLRADAGCLPTQHAEFTFGAFDAKFLFLNCDPPGGWVCCASPPASIMTPVGFEPAPFRTGALSQRLRPLGQSVLMAAARHLTGMKRALACRLHKGRSQGCAHPSLMHRQQPLPTPLATSGLFFWKPLQAQAAI